MPRASAIPPAAMTGTFTASTICGMSAKVPGWVEISSLRKMPRCPPASLPCPMMPSTPPPSSQRPAPPQPAPLGGGAPHTHPQEPPRLDPVHQRGLRQSEMEAHDIGLGLLDDVAHSRVEGGAVAGRNRRGGINSELPVVRRQSFP